MLCVAGASGHERLTALTYGAVVIQQSACATNDYYSPVSSRCLGLAMAPGSAVSYRIDLASLSEMVGDESKAILT